MFFVCSQETDSRGQVDRAPVWSILGVGLAIAKARRHRTFVVGSSKSTSTKAISIISSKDGTPLPLSYIPDVYLTWELETEQRFTCLQYLEERRVPAAVCAFTSFACVWWSEHCRLYPTPATWTALKTAMHTRWVPPYYQRELLQK